MEDEIEMTPITFIVSAEVVDGHGELVLVDGIDLSRFNENPVGYYNHHRSMDAWWGDADATKLLPILRWENIRKQMIDINGQQVNAMLADAVFDPTDEFSVSIYKKVIGGFINTASIGFRALAWSDDDDDKIENQDGWTITKSQLFEISVVDIPSNPAAVAIRDQMEGMGSDEDDESQKGGVRATSTKNTNDKIYYKSFSLRMYNPNDKQKQVKKQKKDSNSLNKTKKDFSSMANATEKKTWLESILEKAKSLGMKFVDTNGNPATDEEIKQLEQAMSNDMHKAVQDAVSGQLEQLDDLKKSIESVKQMVLDVNKTALTEEKVKTIATDSQKQLQETVEALTSDVTKMKKVGQQTAQKNTNGDGFQEGDEVEDSELLENNRDFINLKTWKKNGHLNQVQFDAEVKGLLEKIKKEKGIK